MRRLTVRKMVATRKGTRVEPPEEGDMSAAKQTPEEVISSPMRTRRSDNKHGPTGENRTKESKSAVTSRSPIKPDPVMPSTPITTRSRHKSGQSDADISEAESTASNTSTRRFCSRQSLVQLTDSTRKLRSQRSALITEPIVESKEDAELSDAQSNCSSVSRTTRRKQSGTTARSVSTRSQGLRLVSEPTTDGSDAESNSSVSRVRSIVTRSTRSSRARHQSSPVREPEKEQTSDAESCSSGFSTQPLARRSSKRNKSSLQSDEVLFVSESKKDDSTEQETFKKLSPKIHGVKSGAQSLVGEQNVSSPLRRSLRNRSATTKDVIISDDEPESSGIVNKVLDEEVAKVEESSERKDADLSVEASAVPAGQSSETQPEENIIAGQMLQPSEASMDEEPAVEKSIAANDSATKETNQSVQDVLESSNICLFVDSDSEKSEHSDDEEDNMQVEEAESAQVVDKIESKKASTKQLQEVSGDGLFVIDTTPGVDSGKKYFLEPDEADEKGKSSGSDDDDDEDENNMEVDEEDDDREQVVDKRKSKKATKPQLRDVSGDGLFVIDTTPGVDSSKKYFLESQDKDDENEVDKEEETLESDEDEEEDFIDKDEDEEETLINRPKSGFVLSSSIDTGISLKEMGGLYINFNATKPNPGPSLLSKMKNQNKKKDELLKKSIITPDFEKKESVPPYTESQHKLKKLRKEERKKTSGRGWFDMKAPELTDELKNDLKALKMRSAMDPKHFYKKNDRDGFPKYFQVGTVVDSPIDFYHSRIPKKERKRTVVEELLADSEFRRYNKKKFKEIIAEKAARAEGKKNRKKKKFRT